MLLLIRFKRLVLSLIAILFGFGILVVSFLRTSAVIANAANPETSSKKMYWGDIKPDHLLYPLSALKEQAENSILRPEERVTKELAQADEKLAQAQELYVQEDADLALTTLIKAEQVLFGTINQYLALDRPNDQTKQLLVEKLQFHHQQVLDLQSQCPAYQHSEVGDLLEQQKGLLYRLGI